MAWDKEMQAALIADGEKLRAMTGEDHGPYFFDDSPLFVNCEHCGTEGRIFRGHPNDPHPHDAGPCPVCGGAGVVEIENEPIEMDDLDEMAGEPR
jgi:hypothetical protein